MNGNSVLLDTNAILYILNGDKVLAELLNGEKLYASIISEMELLSFPTLTIEERQKIQSFLSEFEIVGISEVIRDQTIEVKKRTHLKLPDSIIAATAIALKIPLISADKQFRTVDGLSFILYER
ncbi:MAG: type II toxin-antitoxin system VapC family toxin [Chitinophagaceae bacterium]